MNIYMKAYTQIKTAFQQSEMDYLDAIEALQRECGLSGREAEILVEDWDEPSLPSQASESQS